MATRANLAQWPNGSPGRRLISARRDFEATRCKAPQDPRPALVRSGWDSTLRGRRWPASPQDKPTGQASKVRKMTEDRSANEQHNNRTLRHRRVRRSSRKGAGLLLEMDSTMQMLKRGGATWMPARSSTESNQMSAKRLRGRTEWPRPAGCQWVRCVLYARLPAGWDQIMALVR